MLRIGSGQRPFRRAASLPERERPPPHGQPTPGGARRRAPAAGAL